MLETKELIDKKTIAPSIITVGITWVDGRLFSGRDLRKFRAYYGICHYSNLIFLITPLDWERATTITSIFVDPSSNYCEQSKVCLNFRCNLNRFERGELEKLFQATAFTLGLPSDLGQKSIWFNQPGKEEMWKGFALKPEGGVLKFNESKL